MLKSAHFLFLCIAYYHAVEVNADLFLFGCFNMEWGLLKIVPTSYLEH